MSVPPPGHPGPPLLPELPRGMKPTGRYPNAAGWPPLVALFGGLGIFLAASILAVIPILFGGNTDDAPPLATFLSILIQDTTIVVLVFVVARVTSAVPPVEAIGLRTTKFWIALGFAVAIIVGYGALSAIWDAIVSSPPEELLDEIGADETLLASIAFAFGVCVMAPLAEEILFRGFIFGGMRARWGFWPAGILSGALFGLAHAGGPVEFLVPLAVLGFGFALLYELTKSIFPCIYLHAFNNCVAFSVGLSLRWEWVLVFVGSFAAITLALFASRRMA